MNIDFQVTKINDIKIKPVIDNNKNFKDLSNIIGSSMFPVPFPNIWILSKKNSGKTTCIFHILKNMVYKDCKVIFFVSSIRTDKTYQQILKMLDRKNIEYESYDDFIDNETGDNILENLVQELKEPSTDEDESDNSEQEEKFIPIISRGGVNFGYNRIIKKKKKKVTKNKPKKIYSKYILVCDDLGSNCRNKHLAQIMKTNRHSKLTCIISTQFSTDLLNSSRKQVDYALLFKSLSRDKLETIKSDLDLSLSNDEFYDLYTTVTEEPYTFLWIDVKRENYRKNFDTDIKILKNDKIE